MSNRDNRNLDADSISRRRQAAVGAAGNRQQPKPPARIKVIVDAANTEEIVRICKKMLDGVVGQPDIIFGVEMAIEERKGNNGNYPVVVFLDAIYGTELYDANLRRGFEIPLAYLRMSLEKCRFRNAYEEVFTTFLSIQPEMKAARRLRYEERQTAEQEAEVQSEMTAMGITARLREKAPTLRLVQAFSKKLLTENFGHFRHSTGVVIHVRKGNFDNYQFSVAECPEGHELESVMKGGAHTHRHQVIGFAAERDEGLEGKFLLAQVLRIWLRRELRAIGAMPTLEEASMVAVTPLQPGLATMEAVDAEHAREAQGEDQVVTPVTAANAKVDPGFAEFRKSVDNEGGEEVQTPSVAPVVSTEAPSSAKAKKAAPVISKNADLDEILGDVPGGTLPSDGPARKHAAKKPKDAARRVRSSRGAHTQQQSAAA